MFVEAKSLEEMEESLKGRGWGGEVLEKTRLNDGPSRSDIRWSFVSYSAIRVRLLPSGFDALFENTLNCSQFQCREEKNGLQKPI